MKVLIADDTRTNLLVVKKHVERAGHTVITAEDGLLALEAFKRDRPDLVLLDVMMPKMDGHQAASEIRRLCDLRGQWIPIIFLSAMVDDADLAKGIEAGGDDYLTKPVSPVVLEAKLKAMNRIAAMRAELDRVNLELRRLSELDGLTSIANRRRFDEGLSREWRRASRMEGCLSLILADVDHFKGFNDRYGHQAGDDCLRQVAGVLAGVANRPGDLAARYGGEEFAIILPETESEGARHVAEQAREGIERLEIPNEASTMAEHVTMSLGVATLCPATTPDRDPSEIVNRADASLYEAKRSGRNRVVVSE